MRSPRRKKSRKRGFWALVAGGFAWLFKSLKGTELSHLEFGVMLSVCVVVVYHMPLWPTVSPSGSAIPQVFPDHPNSPWKSDTITVPDDEGRQLSVELGTMDATHRWLKASTELIGIDGKDAIPVERIFLGLASDTGKPIVAIGMASHENATENPEEEDQRARVRAERISSIAIRFFESQPEVRFVNLGARRSDIETNSALERRVAIMAIRCADEGVDLTRGIRNALEALHDRGELLFNPKAYHNWDANRFRVEVSSHGSGVRRVPSCNSAR